jgi:hypothetical protein
MIPISNFDTLNNEGFMPMSKALLRGENFLAASSGSEMRFFNAKTLLFTAT